MHYRVSTGDIEDVFVEAESHEEAAAKAILNRVKEANADENCPWVPEDHLGALIEVQEVVEKPRYWSSKSAMKMLEAKGLLLRLATA